MENAFPSYCRSLTTRGVRISHRGNERTAFLHSSYHNIAFLSQQRKIIGMG